MAEATCAGANGESETEKPWQKRQVRPLRALQGQLRPCERGVAMRAESGDWPIAQQALKNEKPG
jgi:hypothetical protein